MESPDHPEITNAGPQRTIAASQTLAQRTHVAESTSGTEASGGDSGEEDGSR